MNRGKRRIKFSNKSHAINGIISTILGAISFLLMIALVIVSYFFKGEAGVYIGSLGLTAFVIAVVGLAKGLTSFKERERYYLFSKIGSIFNAIMIALWAAIYLIGTWYL
ncbi:hypothetical protein C8E03_10741 [Lachnotalea glycerini]|uniref:Calcium:proton exchanger n=1 Tax=Lachnotalea glycerini TaxID=1763509 RepID=A0A255I4Y7_9FIRM|nr:DUF6142 family protein [Lachnotalea glycerini]PXV89065.1 hypothetical protein C8E03_10741 [Lachnotalea glycerini]RDY31534.1 hypothetical protein CG710_009280 [Lachnotalea glycerini]